MIAYNNDWLRNLQAREAVKEAYDNECISHQEYSDIKASLAVNFYSPNFFTTVGIFVLTVICVCCMLGLLMLLNTGNGYELMIIFAGMISYAVLEFFVKQKNHYQSGVDGALICMSAILFSLGVSFETNAGATGTSFFVLLFTTYLMLRFSNRVMAVAAFASLVCLLFYGLNSLGFYFKTIIPFTVMLASACIYFVARKYKLKAPSSLYDNCITVFEILSLACFYAAGNYFVTRELTNSMFNLQLKDVDSIPYDFLFKIFSTIIPAVYILLGIKTRNTILLRVGMLSLAASVVTFQYYTHLVTIEAALTLAGIMLIIIASVLTRYLKTSRHGFCYMHKVNKPSPTMPQVESLIIAETFSGMAEQPATGTRFGGGSFGGAGAGEKF